MKRIRKMKFRLEKRRKKRWKSKKVRSMKLWRLKPIFQVNWKGISQITKAVKNSALFWLMQMAHHQAKQQLRFWTLSNILSSKTWPRMVSWKTNYPLFWSLCKAIHSDCFMINLQVWKIYHYFWTKMVLKLLKTAWT